MSDRFGALWALVGIVVGGAMTGAVSVVTATMQSETQLKTVYASNASAIAGALRPKAESFSNASSALIYWHVGVMGDSPLQNVVKELSERGDRAIAAANALAPYLGFLDLGELTGYVNAVSEWRDNISDRKPMPEGLSKRISCHQTNIDLIVAKRLIELDAIALPQMGDSNLRAALIAYNTRVCK